MNLSTVKKKKVESTSSDQNVINRQNFEYETNQSLQNLAKALSALSQKHDQLVGQFESRIKQFEIGLENFISRVHDVHLSTNKKITDFGTAINEVQDSSKKKFDAFSNTFIEQSHFFEEIYNLKEDVKKAKQMIVENISSLHSKIIDSENHANLNAQNIGKDVEAKIPLISPILEQIDNHSDLHKVNMDGLTKEIDLLKKSRDYAEKKFENIYTLIERLKGAKK